MQEQRADLAVWVSAYPGGLPLQMRALENALPIVTAVQGAHPQNRHIYEWICV